LIAFDVGGMQVESDWRRKLRGDCVNRRPDIAIDGGVAVIDGQPLPLNKIYMNRTIDSGAHGSVFEATEIELERTVAVKIWYRQGEHVRAGAIGEVRKLAAVQHPLFVSVYRLETAFDAPYAVMEYLPGPSVKQWLRTKPPGRVGDGRLIDYLWTNQSSLRQRCKFWFLYSAGLRYLYSQGLLHGNPHLGNVIVYDDLVGTLDYLITRPELRHGDLSSLRILDLGTSLFRADPAQIRVREARVILESAGKLFPDFPPAQLMAIDLSLDPAVMLAVLDKYAEYIFELSSVPGMTRTDFDFLDHGLPQLLGWCPFFNYTAVGGHLTTLFQPQDAGRMIKTTLMMMLGRREPDEDYRARLARLEGLSVADLIEQLESASRSLRSPDRQDR
jgi:serine/threonine protein kinase